MFPVMVEVTEIVSGNVGWVNWQQVVRVGLHDDGTAIYVRDLAARPIIVRQSPEQLIARMRKEIQVIRKEPYDSRETPNGQMPSV